uniref:Uncharacterized protein n=1 Tax=Anguilla anguilla TaxID=7936 RepID=A0A0E9QQE3_ANGAN
MTVHIVSVCTKAYRMSP